jgi:hypothetical protein
MRFADGMKFAFARGMLGKIDRWVVVLFLAAIGVGCSTSSEGAAPAAATPNADAGEPEQAEAGKTDTTPLPKRVQTIADGLHALLECPNRVWGSDTWTDRQILFVGTTKKQAYLWNDQANKGTMHAVPFAELPKSLTQDFYFDFVDYRGVKTVAVSLDTTELFNSGKLYTDFAVLLAIHEGFHLWTQLSWPVSNGATAGGEASERDPEYPDVWRLRYLRSQLLGAMQSSLEISAPLGNAAYWNQTLRAEHASEMESLAEVDVLEGTAQYAGTIAVVLGKLGCAADEKTIFAEVKANAATFMNGEKLDPSGEPYNLGLVALQLLRQSSAKGFEAKIEAGMTPVDVLFEGVTPIAQTEDPTVVDAVKTKIEARNTAASKWIDPLLTGLDAPASVRIVLPMTWAVGAYERRDAYYLANEPGRPLAEQLGEMTLEEPVSGVTIKLMDVNVISGVNTPCGPTTPMDLVVPLGPTGITLSANETKLSAQTSELEVTDLPIQVKTDTAGLKWVCPAGS